MRSLYLIISLFLCFYLTNVSCQEILSYNIKGENYNFNKTEREYYVRYDNTKFDPNTLLENNVVDKIDLLGENSCITYLYHDMELNEFITFLRNKYGDKIQQIDYILRQDDVIHINTGEFILKTKNMDLFNNSISMNNYIIRQNSFIEDTYIIQVNNSSTSDIFNIVSSLNAKNDVIYAEPNFIKILPILNEYLPNQWSIENNGYLGGNIDADMDVVEAWQIADGLNIKVAVLDEGVQLNHPDLTDNLLLGYDATGGNSYGNANLSDSHGTACAGIISSVDNHIGTKGVAFKSKIIPVRIAYGVYVNGFRYWHTSNEWISNSFIWSKNNGADVISNSWGGGANSHLINDAIELCINQGRNGKGCIILFASGNSNSNNVLYPSSRPKVMSVGASSMCDERKSPHSCDGETNWGSNYGTELDVVAPGVKIFTTTNNSNYRSDFNGTSSACPNVAGVAALILSINPEFTYSEVQHIIESTTDKVQGYNYTHNLSNGTWNNQVGYGRVNAYAAVLKAQEMSKTDLYVKDNHQDTGAEPNTTVQEFWESVDIWVRNNNNGGTAHQNPLYKANGQPNFIKIRVRNRGGQTSTGYEKLVLNWAKASTALSGNHPWQGGIYQNGNPNAPLGGVIDTLYIPQINANQEHIITIPWVVPNPYNYQNQTTPWGGIYDRWHFCLLAKIVADNDPMHTALTNDLGANVLKKQQCCSEKCYG